MARTPSYDDLLAAGAALRTRLAELGTSVDALDELVHDIRLWQRRSAWVVVARNPRQAADFRAETGPFQRPMGVWLPTPGWQRRLDNSLGEWLRALDRMRYLSLAER